MFHLDDRSNIDGSIRTGAEVFVFIRTGGRENIVYQNGLKESIYEIRAEVPPNRLDERSRILSERREQSPTESRAR